MSNTAEYQKAYYWNNRERVLAIARKANAKYREANKEKDAERKKIYKQNNKNKSAILESKRRSLKMNVMHSDYTLEEVLNTWGNVCYICNNLIDLSSERRVGRKGWEDGLHLDHVIPLSKGGADSIENVKPTHGSCNIKKGNKIKDLNKTQGAY